MPIDPVQININIKKNGTGAEEAQSSLGSFNKTLNGVMQAALGFSLANVASEFTSLVKNTVIGTIQMTSEFDKMMHTIQGNTAMSDADIDKMRQTVLKLAADSGLPFDQLANGFMHITNEGYSATDATTMLSVAMKAAVDTGGNASDIANSLAVIMHNFGGKASEASDYMNKLMVIAAHGNLTLGDLANNFQLVSSIASNAHVPIEQLGAMFDVLTKSTGDAARAQFEEERILTSIIEPTKQAKTELENLSGAIGGGSGGGVSKKYQQYSDAVQKTKNSLDAAELTLKEQTKKYGEHSDQVQKTNDRIANLNLTLKEHQAKLDGATTSVKTLGKATGVDLANDFTAAGLQAKGLTGVLEDVYKATGGNAEALKQLFPDQRAFIGVTALMKQNLSEYKDNLKQAGDATKNDLLNSEYQKRAQDFDVQLGKLKVSAEEFGMKVATDAMPKLTSFVKELNANGIPALEGFYNVIKNNKNTFFGLSLDLQQANNLAQLLSSTVSFNLSPNLKGLFSWIDSTAIPGLAAFGGAWAAFGNTAIDVINTIISGMNSLAKFGIGIKGLGNISTIPHIATSTPQIPTSGAIMTDRLDLQNATSSPINIYNTNNFNGSNAGPQLSANVNWSLSTMRH